MEPQPAESQPPEPAQRDATAVEPAQPEPHALAGLGNTIRRLPRYLSLARALVGDRRLSRWRKAALGAGIAYLASPIDLVPGLIPVVGQLDDLAAVLLALRFALRGLPPPAAERQLAAAGLTRADLDEDLASVRRAAGWVARRAASVSGSAARTSARAAVGASRLALRAGRRAARALSRRAERAVRGRRKP